jgi:WD40 repeat protein
VAKVEMITNTWQGAAGASTPRSSLKLDSKASTGMGSSLVVNPRGVRSAHSQVTTAVGADYELLEVIGKGGMGVVYSARQASVDRMVAVKMIRPTAAADAERREKFLSEAVVTGDLDHPNIVPIYELGTNENDALFYSMKRVQGTPWSQVIAEKSLSENLEILMKVADAVAFAHSNGVVHRDLKPDNVMLGDFGEVLVMDWGLALATSSFRHSDFVTGRDSMGGTPAYMAPEMVTGPFEIIGQACDIYLLGALLFEVVTGRPPHYGTTAQECLLAAARNEIQPCEETGELVDIAYHAMATEPQDRFPSVQEFQSALRDYQSHCESISLATRADTELVQARRTGDYDSFAHAVFGFQEALVLWEGNLRARAGVDEAKLAYARRAQQKGDYELGISLLDSQNSEHASLQAELEASQRERDARQKWLTRFKRIAAALVILVFGVISVSLYLVAQAKNQETAARMQAVEDRDAAQRAEKAARDAREQEIRQKNKAIAAEAKARQEEVLARAAEAKAKSAEEEERKQKLIAIDAENKAREEEQKAVAAKRGEEYAAYVARVGMAAARIDENAFDTAESLLAACVPAEGQDDLRNWEWGYLMRLCRQGVNFPARGTVSSVAFSPDGKWFVTGGEDGKAHLWDPRKNQPRLSIDHGGYVHAVAVSPDGGRIATGGGDGLVRIARTSDGAAAGTLAGHEDRVLDVAFSPGDGRWLLTASRDRTARVWDTTTGREIADSPLRGHSWWVWSAAFSADGKQIVTAGQDGKVIVWSLDVRGAQPRIAQQKVFLGHAGPVYCAAFSPDGRQVASGGADKRVLVWEPGAVNNVDFRELVSNAPLAQQPSRSFEGHSAPVRAVSFSADGQALISGSDDNTVRIWDAMTGRLETMLRGHSRPVQACAISPDGRQVLSGGLEGQIKLWNLLDYQQVRAAHGRLLVGHDDAILSAAFARDGARVVTASRDHTARIYDAASGQSLHWLKEGHDFLASKAIFFNGGRWLLSAAGDNSVRVWDAATGSELCAIEGTGRNAAVAVSGDAKWILTGTAENVLATSAAAPPPNSSPDTGASQPRIALWKLDARGKSPQRQLLENRQFGTGHRAIVTAVAISPDGRLLYSGDDAGVGKLWDAATGAEVRTLAGHTRAITDVGFTPDGRRLLTASQDGTVSAWDMRTRADLPQVLSHVDPRQSDAYDAPVKAMAISGDGRQVLTLSEDTRQGALDSVVRVWDAERASVIHELYRGGQTITSVAFGQDGRTALAAGTARQLDAGGVETQRSFVRRWDLASGREVKSADGKDFLDFAGRQESVWAAIDAPKGTGVLTVGGTGAALWNGADLDKPDVVFKPHSGVTSAGFSPSGKLVVTSSTDRRAKVWNAETGTSVLQLPAEHARAITSASFSPVDEDLVVTASNDGTARIWQVSKRSVLRVLEHREGGAAARPVRAAIFSPDGKLVLTAGDDGAIRIWDAAGGQSMAAMTLDAPVLCVAYSADGRKILAGGADGRATLFDAASRRPLARYLGHTAAINSVALAPDGRRALSGSSDRTVKLWDTLPAAPVPAGGQQPPSVRTAEATDGPRVAKEILTLAHHDQAVTSVAFSPDGRSILTAGLDGTAVLWLSDDWRQAGK